MKREARAGSERNWARTSSAAPGTFLSCLSSRTKSMSCMHRHETTVSSGSSFFQPSLRWTSRELRQSSRHPSNTCETSNWRKSGFKKRKIWQSLREFVTRRQRSKGKSTSKCTCGLDLIRRQCKCMSLWSNLTPLTRWLLTKMVRVEQHTWYPGKQVAC